MSGRVEEQQPQPQIESPWDGRFDRRRPTTAELAVPWLIGIILLLIGMVIVLVALLLTTESQGGVLSPTGTAASGVAGSTGTPGVIAPSPSEAPIGGPLSTSPPPTPTPGPQFGDLEIAFLARELPAAPISVLRDDFGNEEAAVRLAGADEGVSAHDWAPDGSVGAAIIAGQVMALAPDQEPRALTTDVTQITFGADAATLYAVRVADAADGLTETSTLIALDFATGEEREITEVAYDNPVFGFTGPLDQAQFADEGGAVRLYWLADGFLCLFVFGGPTVTIDPADGTQRPVERQPVLSSPDGSLRIEVTPGDSGRSALEVLTADGSVQGAAGVAGLVSHVRWSPSGDRVIFTAGTPTADGGVRQDLFVWTLTSDEAPTALTTSGAAFGAEWLGAMESWRV